MISQAQVKASIVAVIVAVIAAITVYRREGGDDIGYEILFHLIELSIHGW